MNLNICGVRNYNSNFVKSARNVNFRGYSQNPVQNLNTDYQNVDLTNPNLQKSWQELENVQFSPEDIKYVQNMGVVLPFQKGKDAVDFMKNNNIKIGFAQLDSPHIHAQYDDSQKLVKINSLYKDSTSLADITAISGAIMHEMGHAKDKDGVSSVQEEMDCLAMNALADRAFIKKYGMLESNSLIVKDGTRVYDNLYFDSDPQHRALIARLKQKYGTLPAGGLKHPPSKIAISVKSQSS